MSAQRRKQLAKNKKISDTKHKKKVSELSLKEKLEKIEENNEREQFSIQRLSKRWNIPYTTLHKHLSTPMTRIQTRGRQGFITPEIQQIVDQKIDENIQKGTPFTKKELFNFISLLTLLRSSRGHHRDSPSHSE